MLIGIRFQEQSAQRRREGERIDSRDAHGNRHRNAELGIKGSGSAAHHGYRKKHCHEYNGRGKYGRRYPFHGIIGGENCRLIALVKFRLYRFHHHDGVIDHSPYGKHKGEQGKQVDGKSNHGHYGECADDGYKDGNRGNKRGLDVLQEHIHHHNNQKYRLDKRPYDRMDGGIQELVGIGKYHEFCSLRQVTLQVIEYLMNFFDGT